jgi:VanZ family protein
MSKIKELIEKFTDSAQLDKALGIYIVTLIILHLWPFDFYFNGVRWSEEHQTGIQFKQKGQVVSQYPAKTLYDRVLKGSGLSLEVWLKSQNEFQTGPARIVSFSSNIYKRNFTLGQSEKKLVMRLRTTSTDMNGMNPEMEVDNAINSTIKQHVIITYDFSEQCVYINGIKKVCQDLPGGNFENWDPSYFLIFGNEASGTRPWLGEIFFVAIYNRVISEKEIQEKYTAEYFENEMSVLNDQSTRGLVARYLFDENSGRKIKESHMKDYHLDLYIPKIIRNYDNSFLNVSNLAFPSDFMGFLDALAHIIVFVPLGLALPAAMRQHFGNSRRTSTIAFIALTVFAFIIESAQYFILSRHSDLFDFACHILGNVMGIISDKRLA